MQRESIREAFDQMADRYDSQWARLSALNEALHLLMGALLSELPGDAHFLCVGAGTGAELRYLAGKFPRWHFTVVEPSAAMLEVCRRNAVEAGFADRCHFHRGYVELLPAAAEFHGASALLVSQFILEREERAAFFRDIACRLQPGGILVSSDLSSDMASAAYRSLLEVWLRMMRWAADMPPEGLDNMRNAYGRDVAVLPAEQVEKIIECGGFGSATPFYQAGLIRAWYSHLSTDTA
ncbi:class I SAM-dependent methyltransferase [Microbulbifer taiwanensis]|uniref:Class I SAM-dependent methyltransferase n=1 Tax=Microbulbifer taiwanensis TaxID=986746 RepID=A0ABW1YNM2_9GAMM|nr:class I SAM-dependent methyltransferase [Microbulbifer taiwanensis]